MEGPGAAAIAPLEERESIEDRVAQSLRALIVAGQLPEGTQLVQRDLAARLGVSQTPVRASLGQLQREGFVAVGSTGRAFVSRLTREDFEEIYAARLGLEGLAARLGAEAVGATETRGDALDLTPLERAAAASRTSTATSRCAGSSTARATGRAAGAASSRRSSASTGARSGTTVSCSRRRDRFRESLDRYAAFFADCEANDGGRRRGDVQDSLRWAVDSVAAGLPSEAEFA